MLKGGPSVEVLLDLALDYKNFISKKASDILKTQVFLYEADMERLEKAYKNGNKIAEDLLNSYAKAEFFTSLPDIPEKIVKKVKGNQIQIKLLKNSDHRLSEPFDLKVINESIASAIKKN